MKKQILLLIVAFFAVTSAFGQNAVKVSDPRPLSCENDALHPIAGKAYEYELDATPAGGQFTWWATKDANFVSTSGTTTTLNTSTALTTATGLLATGPNYNTPDVSNKVSITWSSALLAATQYQGTPSTSVFPSPTFVAAYYAAPAGQCSDNFKVFEIHPVNGFTVDILSLDPATQTAVGTGQTVYDYDAEQCVDQVRGAVYAAGKVTYNYGTNILYYEVVAANFSESWTPTFQLTGLQSGQTADIVWDYSTAFGATSVTVATGVSADGEYLSPNPVLTNQTNTNAGVSIFVKVTIHNGTWETLAAQTVNVAVAGQNKESLWDVDNNIATADCSLNTKTFEDAIDQLINPRPTVVEGTTSTQATNTGLIPNNP